MIQSEEHKLDNPVWFSLQETHKPYCLNYKKMLCYSPTYCPFGAVSGSLSVSYEMNEYAKQANSFYIVGNKPEHDSSLIMKKELTCLQMIIHTKIEEKSSDEIVRLNDLYENELHALVNQVQPGYFNHNTSKLGAYYGIFKEEKLVAVAGERMKTNNFTEISAVVTHPDHTGKGYAKQLITFAVNEVLMQDRIPFLHVAEYNTTAIGLYQKLGLNIRRKISFWHFETAARL